ncbi:hypothetical protein SUNI508_03143 [Seiridium unicorne]|uniref:Uncharacterized protein n=1 Tax=Seiridium unicorne TaxID=138068 RepID=A0ABR2VFU8_9PEZI
MHSLRRAATAVHPRSVQSRATTTPRIVTPALTCRRHVHLEGLALAPVVFGGLFVALWTWKCCMMVIFQNKIIFMPGLPPNARGEKIEDYTKQCAGICWREERLRASDGKNLALCVADVELGQPPKDQKPVSSFYILYFQGNASSIPPRLPDLSSVLAMLKRQLHNEPQVVRLTFVCLSYRGYWTSKGRPTEKGIRLDAAAALNWISRQHDDMTEHHIKKSDCSISQAARVVLWGQSIGSGVATNLAAEHDMPKNLLLDSLILETPFTSIRAMLEVLYPQKWLPYKYLWPFLRNHLDSWKNIGLMSKRYSIDEHRPSIFILKAAKDELVPTVLSHELHDRAKDLEFSVGMKAVQGAFHNDTMFRAEGRRFLSEYIARRIQNTRGGDGASLPTPNN